ncbi:MAG: peptidase U32 family protein [Coriobacteriia bacterium]|nr:peptidase U32 family protein [Coriobacteriia bacterium]
MAARKIQLRAPAGTLPSLRAAVDAGADGVFTGLRSLSNIRNFPGINFSVQELREGLEYAHERDKEIYVAINAYPQGDLVQAVYRDIETTVSLGVDALIIADLAAMRFVHDHFPEMPVQVSVQGGAATARFINMLRDEFGIKGVVLPRILSMEEIAAVRRATDVEIETFAFGLLCINYEPNCTMSCYVTGVPNQTYGACSPAELIEFDESADTLEMRLDGYLMNSFTAEEVRTYPTPCKGRYREERSGRVTYPFQSPSSLQTMTMLPAFVEAGVDALKIEGRQRSKMYVREAVSVFREAIDAYYADPARFTVRPEWEARLAALFEGGEFTTTAYGEKT